MVVLLKALPGHRIGRQQITSPHRHLDNGTLVLNRLSKLKRHLLEKMSIVCWLGYIPHTSGKVVNFNTCIIFFWFFLPQMIHYMTVNQEPGFEWSPMPLHMHTSIAQPAPPLLHRIQEICMCRAVLSPWCQRWLNPEACKSKTHLGDLEWRQNGRKAAEGICFHASINMFSLLDKSILMHVSEKVEYTTRLFQRLPEEEKNVNTFNNTVSLFKRSVNFLLHPTQKPTWVKHTAVFSFALCEAGPQFEGPGGVWD